ncbi:MAG TPA: hypothetical protein VK338_02515, partial [Candidatus Nitrosocosmicus sp.]|nr:hypothetical protein [Candidatus Nitrosocosmicus sp.]
MSWGEKRRDEDPSPGTGNPPLSAVFRQSFRSASLTTMSNTNISQKTINILLIGIVILGIVLRLQHFSRLPYDGHPMRQTDTESVAYNFAFRNSNILYPQNSIIRPVSNTEGYFFLEFPSYQYGIGMLYKLFGWHIEIARTYNIILYGIAVLSLYYFLKHFINQQVALFSAFFFTLAPGSIFFFGHAIHPDIFMMTMLLLSFASYIKWIKSKKLLFFIMAVLTLSLSVATRPFVLIVL